MCPCPYILHRGLPDPRRAGSCCRKGWSPPLELGGGCRGFLQHRRAVFPQRVVVWFSYRHLSAGSQCCHHCCAGPWPVVNVFPRGQLAAGAGVSQRWLCSNSSACRGYVALLCPLYGQTPALPDTSFLCQTVLCLWERLPYAGLGKNGKAKRLVPLVQSGLKAQKHTDTTVVSHPFTNMHGNLCKPYRHSCGNNIGSYR